MPTCTKGTVNGLMVVFNPLSEGMADTLSHGGGSHVRANGGGVLADSERKWAIQVVGKTLK